MDTREEMKRWLAVLVQIADEADSKQIKADIDLLLGTASHLIAKVTERNAALAKQCRSRKAKPPKPSPQKGPQKGNGAHSSTDTPQQQNPAWVQLLSVAPDYLKPASTFAHRPATPMSLTSFWN